VVNREANWNDNIEETGQDGWTITKELPLPKKLTKCLQDCSVHGIKIRHKVKLTVALKNPDGHVSEVRSISTAKRARADLLSFFFFTA
jgi:hypothetical protein